MATTYREGASVGRQNGRPRDIPKAGWRDILLRTKDDVSKDNLALISAGVAFYGVLAIFPAIAALVSIYGLVADPDQIQRQLQAASGLIPEGARSVIGEQLTKVAGSGTGTLSLTAIGSVLVALWSASKATKAFMVATNIAYGEEERRGFLKLNLVALALTLCVIVLAVVAIAGIVAVPAILANIDIGTRANRVITWLRWPVIGLVFIFALAVLYRFAPSRSQPAWRWVSAGSIAAVLLWLVGSIAFSIYVRNFGSYNETYGSLGAFAGLMVWFWLSAFIVILGAELNAEMERQNRRETTVGEAEIMGRRGSPAADPPGVRR